MIPMSPQGTAPYACIRSSSVCAWAYMCVFLFVCSSRSTDPCKLTVSLYHPHPLPPRPFQPHLPPPPNPHSLYYFTANVDSTTITLTTTINPAHVSLCPCLSFSALFPILVCAGLVSNCVRFPFSAFEYSVYFSVFLPWSL